MLDDSAVPSLPHVTVSPVQPLIGAEIAGIDIANASEAERDLIHQALLRYKVIFFRDQTSLDEKLEMAGDARLRLTQDGDDLAAQRGVLHAGRFVRQE